MNVSDTDKRGSTSPTSSSKCLRSFHIGYRACAALPEASRLQHTGISARIECQLHAEHVPTIQPNDGIAIDFWGFSNTESYSRTLFNTPAGAPSRLGTERVVASCRSQHADERLVLEEYSIKYLVKICPVCVKKQNEGRPT